MKPLFFGLLFFPFSTFLFSQDFAPINTKWIYITSTLDTAIASINRDTIIESEYYTIMTLAINNQSINESEIILFEENDIVYFYENNSKMKFLDFSENLQIGDTIEYNLPANIELYNISEVSDYTEVNNPYFYRIELIDTVFTENLMELKRYHVESWSINTTEESCNSLQWIIEDVGTSPMLFKEECISAFGRRSCFVNYTSPEKSFQSPLMCTTTSTNELNNESNVVYPNPFYNSIEIIGNIIDDIKIYDFRGVIVATQTQNLESLPTGIYYVNYKMNNTNYINKVVKIE